MQTTAKKRKRGFTLIELLVVLAIIGILASIVLVSLTGARTRAKDTRVVSDLNQIRTVAEVINSAEDSYASVVNNADINTLMDDMNTQKATSILRTGDANGYCVEAQMQEGKWGCVNSGLAAVFDCDDENGTGCDGTANGAPSETSCECGLVP